MKLNRLFFITLTVSLLSLASSLQALEPLPNLDFEKGLEGWNNIWSRDPQTATITPDTTEKHAGAQSVKIVHTGKQDWAFPIKTSIPVAAGEKYEWKGWVKISSITPGGNITLCTVGFDSEKKPKDFMIGKTNANSASTDWQEVCTEFTVPDGIVTILPRVIGGGASTLWLDDFTLTKK